MFCVHYMSSCYWYWNDEKCVISSKFDASILLAEILRCRLRQHVKFCFKFFVGLFVLIFVRLLLEAELVFQN